jgi:hypothetical protein
MLKILTFCKTLYPLLPTTELLNAKLKSREKVEKYTALGNLAKKES